MGLDRAEYADLGDFVDYADLIDLIEILHLAGFVQLTDLFGPLAQLLLGTGGVIP